MNENVVTAGQQETLVQPGFELSAYRFALRAEETLLLPEFVGTTLRGAFGSTFKRTVCVVRNTPCQQCPLLKQCAYPAVFEASPPEGSQRMPNQEESPRPFVFEPPVGFRRVYQPGETFAFQLIIIGRMVNYLPYFVYAFLQVGERYGLGYQRAKYTLTAIDALTPAGEERIYTDDKQYLKPSSINWDWGALEASVATWPRESLMLEFVTPTHLASQGKAIQLADLRFEGLMRAIFRRGSTLASFFCGREWHLDYGGLLHAAADVTLTVEDGDWVRWGRYSKRQGRRMPMKGFVGKVTLQGDLEPFLPFLKLGEWLHVGKHTTFGLGRYRVIVAVELSASPGNYDQPSIKVTVY